MNIEQRAHDAAMAHATSMGIAGSDQFANAYMYVYGLMVDRHNEVASEEKKKYDAAYEVGRKAGYDQHEKLHWEALVIANQKTRQLEIEKSAIERELKSVKDARWWCLW